jgi:hypothetical protein
VDGAEAGAYPWVRGDPVFALEGRRVASLAAAPDPRFAEAGLVPQQTGGAAGARLVFHRAPDMRRLPTHVATTPIKLLVVEEDLVVE